MEAIKFALENALITIIENYDEIRNEQLVRDLGSLIYRTFPSKATEEALANVYKDLNIMGSVTQTAVAKTFSIPTTMPDAAENRSGNVGYKVWKQGTRTTETVKVIKKSPAVIKPVVETDQDEYDDIDLGTSGATDAELTDMYIQLLSMDEEQLMAHFGTLPAAKKFAENINAEVAKNANVQTTLAAIQKKLNELV